MCVGNAYAHEPQKFKIYVSVSAAIEEKRNDQLFTKCVMR